MYILKIILCFSIITILSCEEKKSHQDVNLLKNDTLYNSDLNWKMKKPKSWYLFSNLEIKQKQEKLKRKDSDNLGFMLEKDFKYSFQSIYFLDKYNKLDFQKDKNWKFHSLQEQGYIVDSTHTEIIKIGNKTFEKFSLRSKNENGEEFKEINFSGNVENYQLLIAIICDTISEKEILNSFYNSTFD